MQNKIFSPTSLRFVLIILNSILLLMGNNSMLSSIILIISSLILAYEPISLVSLILISSISSSIAIVAGFSAFFYYEFVFIIACFLRKKPILRITTYTFFIFLYIFWIMLCSLNSLSGDITAGVKMCVAISPLLVVPMFKFNTKELEKYLLITAIASSLYITCKLIFNPILFIPEGHSAFSTAELQITISPNINPNTVSQALFLLYIIIYIFAINKRKLYLLVLTLSPILSIALIGSRTVFISLIVVSFLIYLHSSQVKTAQKILVASIVILLGTFIFELIVSLNERLVLTSILEDRGSGRFDTWQYLFSNVIPSNLLFGIGYGRVNMYDIGFDVDADNMYVDALTQMGVIGLSLIIGLLLNLWKRIRRNLMITSQIALALIVFVFLAGVGETMYDTLIFVYILLYSAISIYSVNKS